jgi:hypothetical protein
MSVGRPDLDHAVTAKPTRAPLVLLVAALVGAYAERHDRYP